VTKKKCDPDAPRNCPLCKKSWLGTRIPTKNRKAFGGAKYFKLELGIYDLEMDGTVAFQCPHCKKEISRGFYDSCTVR
jgi:hypothetical protein